MNKSYFSGNAQANHFNTLHNQYDISHVLHPPIAQRLEQQQLFKSLPKPPLTVVDFGSGSGRTTFALLQKGYNVHAVDIAQDSLTLLQKMYKRHKKLSWGSLYTSAQIPKDILFDGIVGTDILHHVYIPDMMPLLFQAIKKGGFICFSEPNGWHLPWYGFYVIKGIWHVEHGIFQCTIPTLTKEFIVAGFRRIAIDGHGLIPTNLSRFMPYTFAKLNAQILGNLWLCRAFAFRLIIKAIK